jgi:serine/threonine-protein kinase
VNAGLSPVIRRAASESIAPNRVISQDPPADVPLKKGSVVRLVVSNGKPTVALRDVTGYTVADAGKDLKSDGLQVHQIHRFDASAKDTVLSQSPSPGSKVRKGSAVTLVVSDGPAPIKVPNLVGMTMDEAQAVAAKNGFTISVTEEAPIANVPPHVIASQETPPGHTVAAGATIDVVVSKGGGLAQVPDVRGQDFLAAQQALKAAGFDFSVTYAQNPTGPSGTIINEQPQGGTPAEKGSQIQLWLSVTGEVPDTEGMTLDAAKRQLLDYGYQLGNVTPTVEGADGKVVRTEPEAGTQLAPNTPVNIYVNSANAQQPAAPATP